MSCRRLVAALNELASKMEGTAGLSAEDERLLGLAQGWAHGATHAFFFYFRWAPCAAATLFRSAAWTWKACQLSPLRLLACSGAKAKLKQCWHAPACRRALRLLQLVARSEKPR